MLHLVQAEATWRLEDTPGRRQRRDPFAPWTRPIELSTIDAAIHIAQYLIPHAQAAFRSMEEGRPASSTELGQALRVFDWLRNNRQRVVSP